MRSWNNNPWFCEQETIAKVLWSLHVGVVIFVMQEHFSIKRTHSIMKKSVVRILVAFALEHTKTV
jgi:hypothetical protein